MNALKALVIAGAIVSCGAPATSPGSGGAPDTGPAVTEELVIEVEGLI